LLEEVVPPDLVAEAASALRRYAFQDIDATAQERSFGWVAFDNMLDSSFSQEPVGRGDYLTFALRLDTRRVPAAVFKKHLIIALTQALAEAKENGRKFLSKEEKADIRERVALQLRARFLPIPAVFPVVWNVVRSRVYLASIHPKVIELFHEMFTATFGLHLEPLNAYFMARDILGRPEAVDAWTPTIFVGGGDYGFGAR